MRKSTDSAKAWHAPPAARRTIPFDYVFRFDGELNELRGQPGLVHNSTVDISIEAAFTAVSIGYGVVPKVDPITFGVPLALIRPNLHTSIFDTASRRACYIARREARTKRSRSNSELLTGRSGRAPPRC